MSADSMAERDHEIRQIADEFPGWEAWQGLINGLWHARLVGQHPASHGPRRDPSRHPRADPAPFGVASDGPEGARPARAPDRAISPTPPPRRGRNMPSDLQPTKPDELTCCCSARSTT